MEVSSASQNEQSTPSNESTIIQDIEKNFLFFERAVRTLESRFSTRALRNIFVIRKQLSSSVCLQLIQSHFSSDHPRKQLFSSYLDEKNGQVMEIDEIKASKLTPEIEIYIGLLILLYLLDSKSLKKATSLSIQLINLVRSFNRRTMDQLAARVYFYYARVHEIQDKTFEIRNTLLLSLRTATLRHDDETQATLLNLLLRNYLQNKLYEQATKLASKTTFPETASNHQIARYMYYLGRINAIQLDYTTSYKHLVQATRKATTSPATAGFQQAVSKFLIIVQLLMGEIPERSLFRQTVLRKALIPYLNITQAVRIGDLNLFQSTLVKFSEKFRADDTYTLILRLRHNVIKTGIRMISLSYSKISLRDICMKLHLDSEEDAEYVVAKAIRDGVIDAVIDHVNGFIQSKEIIDVYSTNEPQKTFHQRISFCLNLHNESVKALRFPVNAHRKELASAEAARERERELVKEIEEADLDEDDVPEY